MIVYRSGHGDIGVIAGLGEVTCQLPGSSIMPTGTYILRYRYITVQGSADHRLERNRVMTWVSIRLASRRHEKLCASPQRHACRILHARYRRPRDPHIRRRAEKR